MLQCPLANTLQEFSGVIDVKKRPSSRKNGDDRPLRTMCAKWANHLDWLVFTLPIPANNHKLCSVQYFVSFHDVHRRVLRADPGLDSLGGVRCVTQLSYQDELAGEYIDLVPEDAEFEAHPGGSQRGNVEWRGRRKFRIGFWVSDGFLSNGIWISDFVSWCLHAMFRCAWTVKKDATWSGVPTIEFRAGVRS